LLLSVRSVRVSKGSKRFGTHLMKAPNGKGHSAGRVNGPGNGFASTYVRAFLPICMRSSESLLRRTNAAHRLASSPGSTTKPFSPDRTISGTPPTFVATTGSPRRALPAKHWGCPHSPTYEHKYPLLVNLRHFRNAPFEFDRRREQPPNHPPVFPVLPLAARSDESRLSPVCSPPSEAAQK